MGGLEGGPADIRPVGISGILQAGNCSKGRSAVNGLGLPGQARGRSLQAGSPGSRWAEHAFLPRGRRGCRAGTGQAADLRGRSVGCWALGPEGRRQLFRGTGLGDLQGGRTVVGALVVWWVRTLGIICGV